MVITKGAPEGLLDWCTGIPAAARAALEAEFAAGNRVIAVATREAPGQSALSPADEHGLAFRGLLAFLDPPKPDARAALERLAGLGVTVKILTGDNPVVAAKVCADLGLPAGQVATGADIDKAGDLADGVMGGRQIFANTIKYVLMGTSSNFGNMFSAAGASIFLTFLPMLPSQILLNNLLYDTSQLAIPGPYPACSSSPWPESSPAT